MQLAFWKAKDRRSITTGPLWLWRGSYTGPRRLEDVPPTTAHTISRRRQQGTTDPHALYGAAGPRRLRLPTTISAARATAWLTAAAAAAALGIHLRADQPRIAAVCAAITAGAALIAAGMFALEVWARQDPLRLNASQAAQVADSARRIDWNPLAGPGTVSTAGAYMLEALDTCAQLQQHPAWRLPATEPLRWQIDLDEEIFQIARAAAALDRFAAGHTDLERQSARQLDDALFDRLVALHRCQHTLSQLSQAAAPEPGDDVDGIGAALAAAVENEMATGAWIDRNADLLAQVAGYTQVRRMHG